MNIYLLTREDADGYDEYTGFVVRAPHESAARELVPYGDEGPDIWLNPLDTNCVLLATDVSGDVEVLLASFRAG